MPSDDANESVDDGPKAKKSKSSATVGVDKWTTVMEAAHVPRYQAKFSLLYSRFAAGILLVVFTAIGQ